MSWVAAAVVGSAVIGGVASNSAAKKGAKATKKAADASIAESQRQFDLTRADTAPYREAGANALGKIQSIFVNGDTSALRNDPGYQFSFGENQRALDNSLVSRGRALSGAGAKAAIRYGQGMADSQANNVFNRLATIAGLGQSGVATSSNDGSHTAGTVANINMNSAASRASSYMAGASGVNNAIQGGLSNILLQRYLNGAPSSGGYAVNYRGPVAGGGLA